MPACLWPETVAAAAKTVLCVVCMQSLSTFTRKQQAGLPIQALQARYLHMLLVRGPDQMQTVIWRIPLPAQVQTCT